jgi:tRNA modification GTPase
MRAGDTIIALASPPGRSARAIIRISGPATHTLLNSVLGPLGAGEANATSTAQSNACGPALLRLPHPTSDLQHPTSPAIPVVLSVFHSPRSYTGEDAAEVQLPGNPTLIERVLSMLAAHEGVRFAGPGEFTARAYLAGKMTLSQAEGVAATIAATNTDQLAAARSLLEGRAGADYRRWADELTTLLALVESGIDFTDQEDVVPIAPAALLTRIDALRDHLATHLGHAKGHEPAHALPRVALVGQPNAGKSTLFNALLGRKRAVTSPISGTTRDVLAEELDLSKDAPGAPTVLLEDLAGLDDVGCGMSDVGCEQALPVPTSHIPHPTSNPAPSSAAHESQRTARVAASQADLLLWCDPTGRFDPAALDIAVQAPIIRVRTFADQPTSTATREDLAVCALDGWHLTQLRRAIAQAATTSRAAGVAALLPRHRRAMIDAGGHLAQAAASIPPTPRLPTPELTATALRSALDALGELVGQITPDEVLGRVFATFCIGK